VFVPEAGALVTADLHVGYTPTLRARGYAVPAVDDDALIARVRTLLQRTGASRLVVAGDFLHGRGAERPLEHGLSSLQVFVRALAPCTVQIVEGNHDRHLPDALAALGLEVHPSLALGPHVVHHGDDAAWVRTERARARARGGRVIVGHLHPALQLDDGMGAQRKVPAFVTAAGLLCLPALSPYAQGGEVRSTALRAQLAALVEGDPMGAAAVVGERVMVVGNVFDARR
jgi:putative SbcD/Mre11-related phosphoesterase